MGANFPAYFFLFPDLRRRISLGSTDFPGKRPCLPQPRLSLRPVASGVRHRRCFILLSVYLSKHMPIKKKPSAHCILPDRPARDRSGACDWLAFGYILASALLGLQRPSAELPRLYLPVVCAGLWHCRDSLDLLSVRAVQKTVVFPPRQTAQEHEYPAAAFLPARLRRRPDFPEYRTGSYLPQGSFRSAVFPAFLPLTFSSSQCRPHKFLLKQKQQEKRPRLLLLLYVAIFLFTVISPQSGYSACFLRPVLLPSSESPSLKHRP